MPRSYSGSRLIGWAVAALAMALTAAPARAVLDVENRGPMLNAGAFAMRITNIGVLGNPFQSVGRSFDVSLEFPRGSGNEMLNHAELWVAADDATGRRRVSGGPMLEWRPTLDPDDHVRIAYSGTPGTVRFFDDDADGRIDEEFLDGKDDDGDGEIDEDLGLFATQTLFARYADDQPEAVNYSYPNGESHVPLHLDVKQEAFTWAVPGFDHVAGLKFTITNHGATPLTDVRIGFVADLDAREHDAPGGHLDDLMRTVAYTQGFNDGISSVSSVSRTPPPPGAPFPFFMECLPVESGRCPVVGESRTSSTAGSVALLPMWHTTDPLGALGAQNRVSDAIVRPFVTAPLHVDFRTQWFANDLPPGQGGLPILDADRDRALAGGFPSLTDTLRVHDAVVMVSCGPFARLDPGRSYELHLALVVSTPDSLAAMIAHALQAEHGGWTNVFPDTARVLWNSPFTGKSGVTGHETCYEPPEGLEFLMDPHCLFLKYAPDPVVNVESSAHYEHGHCVWSDMDCDVCTGFDGNETIVRWRDPAGSPPPPGWRARPDDHAVTVEWDNRSEVLFNGPAGPGPGLRFIGYNLYRLDDWSGRHSDLPAPGRFQQIASFGDDGTLGARPLAEVTDSTVDYERILYERKVYPIGRYRWTDTRVIDGFDYVYVVTAVTERTEQVVGGVPITHRLESPILATLDSVVTPHMAARPAAGGVHVVPNPFRAHVPWDKPPVPGDTFTSHLDFVGLPLARCTIRIYTLAGDLVQRLDHDGSRGDGQARWDLISRNGQDVAPGIYLFTVESALGHQVGRFVLLR